MKVLQTYFPIFILTTLVILFFLPLFWPVPQIFITPDLFLSDILHFYLPTKFLLSESLKSNQIPLWTDLIGTGFPLIGEGNIHALSLINLVLFKTLPFVTAFNFQYVIVFVGLSIGMYLVAREFGWSKLTALFCGVIYAFSGHHIVKMFHLNCLQALSYAPFIFWILLILQKNKTNKLWVFLPFLLCQQTLQGPYQYVFMTIISFGLYGMLAWWIPNKKNRPWIGKATILIGILFLGLTAIQLFPSFEYFLKTGGRADLATNQIGSLKIVHLLQFFSPYILGDNRIGTYPAGTYGVGFHETFSYIGVIPILLALSSLVFIRKNSWIRTVWIVIGILILFALENNSPLYFLFSFPPFSWFRVHSRFLAFITFFLVLLSGSIFHTIEKKFGTVHILVLSLFVISILDILSFAWVYNVTAPASDILKKPELFSSIPNNTRMVAFPNSNTPWYTYMSMNGWKNPIDYIYLLSGGQPDYSLLHGISNLSVYSGALPLKQQALLSLSVEGSKFDYDTKIATISALSLHTLQLHNTEFLISPYSIDQPDIKVVKKTQPKNSDLAPLFLYQLSGIKPQYYLTSRYRKVQFLEEFTREVEKPDALTNYDAFITTEKDLSASKEEGTITPTSLSSTQKIFSVTTPSDTFFVASLYLYPGWNATLDGTKTEIVPANISGMAVFIPKGTHTLVLRFIPISFYLGAIISALTLLVYGIIVIRSVWRSS